MAPGSESRAWTRVTSSHQAAEGGREPKYSLSEVLELALDRKATSQASNATGALLLCQCERLLNLPLVVLLAPATGVKEDAATADCLGEGHCSLAPSP